MNEMITLFGNVRCEEYHFKPQKKEKKEEESFEPLLDF